MFVNLVTVESAEVGAVVSDLQTRILKVRFRGEADNYICADGWNDTWNDHICGMMGFRFGFNLIYQSIKKLFLRSIYLIGLSIIKSINPPTNKYINKNYRRFGRSTANINPVTIQSPTPSSRSVCPKLIIGDKQTDLLTLCITFTKAGLSE